MAGFNPSSFNNLSTSQYSTFLSGKTPEISDYAQNLKKEHLSKQSDDDFAVKQAQKWASENNSFSITSVTSNKERSSKKKAALNSFLNDVKHSELISEGRDDLRKRKQNPNERNKSHVVSTNVYVSNIPSTINTDRLRLFFEEYGHVASVKILERNSSTAVPCQNGFVAYFNHSDAQEAVDALKSGVLLDQRRLIGGWGKPLSSEHMKELKEKDVLLRKMVLGDENDVDRTSNHAKRQKRKRQQHTEDSDGNGDNGDNDEIKNLNPHKQLPIGAFLTTKDQYTLSTLLNALDLTQIKVTNTMMFCLKHSYAAPHVVDMICKDSFFLNIDQDDAVSSSSSLSSSSSSSSTSSSSSNQYQLQIPAPKQVASLYLMSDLLSNSSCLKHGASMYRSSIEENLINIMIAMRKTHSNIRGRISAGAMETRVIKVLDTWNVWGVFNTRFVEELRSLFLHGEKGNNSTTSKKSTVADVDNKEEEDLDGEAMEDEEGEEDLDGEAIDESDF